MYPEEVKWWYFDFDFDFNYSADPHTFQTSVQQGAKSWRFAEATAQSRVDGNYTSIMTRMRHHVIHKWRRMRMRKPILISRT